MKSSTYHEESKYYTYSDDHRRHYGTEFEYRYTAKNRSIHNTDNGDMKSSDTRIPNFHHFDALGSRPSKGRCQGPESIQITTCSCQ